MQREATEGFGEEQRRRPFSGRAASAAGIEWAEGEVARPRGWLQLKSMLPLGALDGLAPDFINQSRGACWFSLGI